MMKMVKMKMTTIKQVIRENENTKKWTSNKEKKITKNGCPNSKQYKPSMERRPLPSWIKICSMIISYRNKLTEEGINVMANAAQQEIVDVHDSDKEKEYIDLDTIGLAAGV